jgi:hypothetical protein
LNVRFFAAVRGQADITCACCRGRFYEYALASCLSMIFSENRCTLFGIMLSSIFRKSGIRFSVRKCDRIRKIEQLLFPWKQKLL